MKLKRRILTSERGQSMMELALSLMALLIMLVGIIDVGRILFYNVSLRDAAEEGVLYGSLKPSIIGDIQNRVRSSLAQYGADGVDIQVNYSRGGCNCITAATACSGDQIQVVVSQPNFPLTTPLLGSFLGTEHISLSNSYTGTVLRPACSPSP